MGRKALTEECFQKIPLKFVGDVQWLQWGEDESTRHEIEAVRTNEGTIPVGSYWTKNPIPACAGEFYKVQEMSCILFAKIHCKDPKSN